MKHSWAQKETRLTIDSVEGTSELECWLIMIYLWLYGLDQVRPPPRARVEAPQLLFQSLSLGARSVLGCLSGLDMVAGYIPVSGHQSRRDICLFVTDDRGGLGL